MNKRKKKSMHVKMTVGSSCKEKKVKEFDLFKTVNSYFCGMGRIIIAGNIDCSKNCKKESHCGVLIIEVSVRMAGGLGMANAMKSRISHFKIKVFNI